MASLFDEKRPVQCKDNMLAEFGMLDGSEWPTHWEFFIFCEDEIENVYSLTADGKVVST